MASTASGSVRPSASSGRRPCSCSTRRSPSRMSVHQGLDRSSRMTPIVRVRRSARLRATGSGRYPSSATALSTACRFSSLTRGEFCSTSDTSDLDTPALAATVRMVGGLPMEGSLAMPDPCGGRPPHVGVTAGSRDCAAAAVASRVESEPIVTNVHPSAALAAAAAPSGTSSPHAFPCFRAASRTCSRASTKTGAVTWPGTPRSWLRSRGPTNNTSTPSTAAISPALATACADSICTMPRTSSFARSSAPGSRPKRHARLYVATPRSPRGGSTGAQPQPEPPQPSQAAAASPPQRPHRALDRPGSSRRTPPAPLSAPRRPRPSAPSHEPVLRRPRHAQDLAVASRTQQLHTPQPSPVTQSRRTCPS